MKIPALNKDEYYDTVYWQLAGAPFFHSCVYYWTKPTNKKYYNHSKEFIAKYEKGGKLAGYTPKSAFIAPGNVIIQELLQGKKDYLKELQSFGKHLKNAIVRFEQLLDKKSVQLKDLEGFFTVFCAALKLIFPFDFAMTEWMKKMSVENKSVSDAFLTHSSPTEKSFIQEEQDDLHEIASAVQKKNISLSQARTHARIRALMAMHFKKYCWIENSYAGSKHLTIDYFWDRLATELEKKEAKNESKLSKTKLPRNLALLAKTTYILFTLRDLRKKLMLIGVELADHALTQIQSKTGIPVEKLIWFNFWEIQKFLQGKLKLTNKYYNQGYRYGILKDGTFYDTDKQFYLEVEKLHEVGKNIREFTGTIAQKGIVRGPCKIVMHYSEIDKVKEGDILVASMTRPDMLPAMKKASAFVTDEGGITSHAAIISRELKKPCITATKIATKVLKDGDIVEVDANKGIVRKVKK